MAGTNRGPLVGITMDVVEPRGAKGPRAECALAYAAAVVAAGGTPVLLPPIPDQAVEHVRMCDAFVLTGGDDPRTEPFGEPTHPKAKPLHPQRQAYEVRLLGVLRDRNPERPVLGVCLGMQLMALHAGGRLDQHLPESLATHAWHWEAEHRVAPATGPKRGPLSDLVSPGTVASKHKQAVRDPGALLALAHSDDGVVEAVADPHRPFYLGVQWHPERTPDPALGLNLFRRLVDATRRD
jgi:putative glutamine amidotransferase